MNMWQTHFLSLSIEEEKNIQMIFFASFRCIA